MALLLPGESARSPRLWGALVGVAAVFALCALGCAAPVRARRLPAAVSLGVRHDARDAQRPAHGDEGSVFVERALHREGLRFGTDGSTRALWGYLRNSASLVAATAARPGDVLFFDTRASDAPASCDESTDHAALVTDVAPGGRITFVEARAGKIRTSFADPAHPTLRRAASGEIANTFLRSKAIDDAPGTRYFAGELLCGVARPSVR
jgi:hypothetical protein